jgi:hypothetical protein
MKTVASRKERTMQKYSDFFQTLHDETGPTGYLGAGTHYSVLRAVVFHDPRGQPLREALFTDFAVIWDKDHDVRVIDPIQQFYGRGLLSSFVMFGESKGVFTAIVPAVETPPVRREFLKKVDDLELSVRSSLCLKNDGIVYLGDLVQKTEAEMLRTPNFGRRSLNEIKEVLYQMGLHLGMEVPGWSASSEFLANKRRFDFLTSQVGEICAKLDDPWNSRVVALEKASGGEHGIIADTDERVNLYLRNLQMLWQLGMEPEPEDEDEEVAEPEEEPASVT